MASFSHPSGLSLGGWLVGGRGVCYNKLLFKNNRLLLSRLFSGNFCRADKALIEADKVIMSYSRKYPPPTTPLPYGRQWMEYLKISGFPRRTMAVYARSHTPLIQNLGEFQNFARFWMAFLEFLSKLTKFWGYSWNSSQADRAFITGFPISSMGGMWIFSGIAQ